MITSAGGAIFHYPVADGYEFTEKDWNDSNTLTNGPYFYSKRVAEEAAWKIYEQHKSEIDLVVVNPLFVVGATKSKALNTSCQNMKKYIMGEIPVPPGFVGFVHVKDVAQCHLIALENPKAVGKRYFY